MQKELIHLYNNQVTLEFNPRSHRYFLVQGEERIPVYGVTSILGILDKPWLMQWAVNAAVDICEGAIKEDVPHPKILLEEIFSQARRGFRKIRQDALDVGTEVHHWIEDYLQAAEKPLLPPEETPVGKCCRAVVEWLGAKEVRPLEIERRLYSRALGCAGTLDMLAQIEGELSLVDWKSSKGIYDEYILQAAAYAGLYEEETGKRVERAYIVRLGKTDGQFEVREIARKELDEAYEIFKCLVAIYKWQKETTKSKSPAQEPIVTP